MASRGVVTKRVTVYRNGDPSFKPVQYTYLSRNVKNFDQLTDEIDRLAPPLRGGGVRCLYTPTGTRKIDSISDFESSDAPAFVAVGTDGFREVKGGYAGIGTKSSESTSGHKGKTTARDPKLDGGVVVKLFIHRNGDAFFKPQLYYFRSRYMRTWIQFMEDMFKIAPPSGGGPVKHFYTLEGEELTDFKQLEPDKGYVAAGIEGYKPIKGGYENSGTSSQKFGGSSPRPGSQAAFEREKTMATSRAGPIMKRKDQTNPEPVFLFVFRNGNGLKPTRMLFTPKQLTRGMPWLLENIAKQFDIYARRLCTMDGRNVNSVDDLTNKGAYVVVPLGEAFRETWYYLPDGAKDTSEGAEESEYETDNEEEQGDDTNDDKKEGKSRSGSQASGYDNDSRPESSQSADASPRASSRSPEKSRRDRPYHGGSRGYPVRNNTTLTMGSYYSRQSRADSRNRSRSAGNASRSSRKSDRGDSAHSDRPYTSESRAETRYKKHQARRASATHEHDEFCDHCGRGETVMDKKGMHGSNRGKELNKSNVRSISPSPNRGAGRRQQPSVSPRREPGYGNNGYQKEPTFNSRNNNNQRFQRQNSGAANKGGNRANKYGYTRQLNKPPGAGGASNKTSPKPEGRYGRQNNQLNPNSTRQPTKAKSEEDLFYNSKKGNNKFFAKKDDKDNLSKSTNHSSQRGHNQNYNSSYNRQRSNLR